MSITISHSVFVKGKIYLWCLERFSPFALPFHECYSSYHGHSNIAIWWKISQRKNHIMKNLLQMFSYIILHTGCMSIKLQTYDHSKSACWVWGWLRVKRVVETALLLLYTPLKNPPSKILTKAISIWGTSRYLLSKGGGYTWFLWGGELGRISCRRQSIRGHDQNPPSQATSPYQKCFQRRYLYFCANATFDNT